MRENHLTPEELAILTAYLDEAKAEQEAHPNKEQCWKCGTWYTADPYPKNCPSCGVDIPPF